MYQFQSSNIFHPTSLNPSRKLFVCFSLVQPKVEVERESWGHNRRIKDSCDTGPGNWPLTKHSHASTASLCAGRDPGPSQKGQHWRSQCHLKGRRRKGSCREGRQGGAKSSPWTRTSICSLLHRSCSEPCTMEIIFGRNKKEQLEPVRARVTGEHFV